MPALIITMVSMLVADLLGIKDLGVHTWAKCIAIIVEAEEPCVVMDIVSVCPIKGRADLLV
jgi:hypothetical protein